ncbi:ROK family protein [Embleya sp. NPDC050154]|uniref:ROK family protein n=1 Tax=Embleya sp. NPDC050154 TaxID=3363988 RepID=UPI0037A2C924
MTEPIPPAGASATTSIARPEDCDDVFDSADLVDPPLPRDSLGIVALDIGGTKTAMAAIDAAGTVLAGCRVATREPGEDMAHALDRLLRLAREQAAAVTRDGRREIVAVGLVCPGTVTSAGVELSPNLPGIENVDVLGLARAAFGTVPVVVANDVKAAGLAEVRSGALVGADPGLFVNLGTGVAAALTVGGRIVGGARGVAGEIGYSLVPGRPDEPDLESLIGGGPLVARTQALYALAGNGPPPDAAAILTSADPRLRAVAEHALDVLAGHVLNLHLALDPTRIALGGGLMAVSDRILDVLRGFLAKHSPGTPDPGEAMVAARYIHDGALRGAAALAWDVVRGERPRWALTTR